MTFQGLAERKNFARIAEMDKTRNRLISSLQRIGVEIAHLIDEIRGDELAPTPPEAIELSKKRICLNCKQQFGSDEQMRRGQCNACYQLTRIRIRSRDVTERQLIERGLLLPAQAGGRPRRRTELDSLLEDAKSKQEAVTDFTHTVGKDKRKKKPKP